MTQDRFEPRSVQEWRDWLVLHHAAGEGVWLVSRRAAAGGPHVSYEDAVRQALCFGWVDSTNKRLDDERTMMRYSPRTSGSRWARTNKARIADLEATGQLAPAGIAVIEAARADGSWSLYDEVDALVVPPDLAAALDAHPPARANFDSFPPSARDQLLARLVQARRPETRAKRIAEVATRAAVGERATDPRP